jgi:hypothetical protein
VKDPDIDAALNQAAQAPHHVDPALVERIAGSVGKSVTPVRPLPPKWLLASGLAFIAAAVALAGAARLGFYGIGKMSALDRALIFSALAGLVGLAATARVAAMIPGSRRRVSPATLLGAGCLLLVTVFAILFRDYHTHRFVAQGVACLTAGLVDAIPAALAGWLLLRRGFAVNPVAAGLVAGTLSGLAGVVMLELHCPNFEAPHVMLWHTAVIPVAAAIGALLAWFRDRRTRVSG